MRVFGSVDTFVEGRHRDLRIGRAVATTSFLQALLRHGDFDRYHLFCPSSATQRALRPVLEDLVGSEAAGRVDLLHQLELPTRLASTRYAVFHCGGWSRYHPRLAWLRAAPGVHPFPITGMIHSLDTVDHAMAQFLAAPYGPCDAVACSSTAGREAFQRLLGAVGRRLARPGAAPAAFPGQLPVIPLGVSDEAFARRDRASCRAALALPPAALVLLWVGRLSAQDKADLVPLLRAVRPLASGRELRLVLAGGADEANLKAISAAVGELGLREQVVLAPNVTDAQKVALLGAADVFVSPVDNVQETFGIAVGEAMAAGLPVVASDWNGYRDLVEHGVTGFLVPTTWARPPASLTRLRGILDAPVGQLAAAQGVAVDQAALTAALGRLAEDPGLRSTLGEAGRKKAQALWTWEAVLRRHVALWRELEVAAQAFRPPPGEDPDIVDLQDAFGHYPTRTLDLAATLWLTPSGAEVLAGRTPPPAVYEDLVPLLDGVLATALLQGLRDGPRPLGTLADRLPGRASLEPGSLEYAALWLLKHGLLALEAPAGHGP
jgi:glycosyltransferase involved in cell wall biosynthesis